MMFNFFSTLYDLNNCILTKSHLISGVRVCCRFVEITKMSKTLQMLHVLRPPRSRTTLYKPPI